MEEIIGGILYIFYNERSTCPPLVMQRGSSSRPSETDVFCFHIQLTRISRIRSEIKGSIEHQFLIVYFYVSLNLTSSSHPFRVPMESGIIDQKREPQP